MPNISVGNPTMTIEQLLKQPMVVSQRLRDINDYGYIMDTVLRPGPSLSDTGAIRVMRTEDIFPDGNPVEIPEGAEYPIVGPTERDFFEARVRKYGFKMRITEEAQNWSLADEVNKNLKKMSNGLIQFFDSLFLSAILNETAIRTIPAGDTWTPDYSHINRDFAAAKKLVRFTTGPAGDFLTGFNATDVLVSSDNSDVFEINDTILQAFRGDVAGDAPMFKGFSGQLWGLNVLHSPHVPDDIAIFLQRNDLGFISDATPAEAKLLPFDESTDCWWLKARRRSVPVIDEPLAAVIMTDIA